jgi:hypothetical protein
MYGRPFSEFQDFRKSVSDFMTTNNRLTQFAYIANIVWPAVANNQSIISKKRETILNINRHTITSPYPEGSAVMIKNIKRTQKTDALWLGPYTVVRCNRGGAYTLQHQDGTILPRDVPPSQLKFLTDHPSDFDQADIYQINKVTNHRQKGNKYEYLVRWKNYNGDHDSWIPYSGFIETDTITEYWKRLGKSTPHAAPTTPKHKPTSPAHNITQHNDSTTITPTHTPPTPSLRQQRLQTRNTRRTPG